MIIVLLPSFRDLGIVAHEPALHLLQVLVGLAPAAILKSGLIWHSAFVKFVSKEQEVIIFGREGGA